MVQCVTLCSRQGCLYLPILSWAPPWWWTVCWDEWRYSSCWGGLRPGRSSGARRGGGREGCRCPQSGRKSPNQCPSTLNIKVSVLLRWLLSKLIWNKLHLLHGHGHGHGHSHGTAHLSHIYQFWSNYLLCTLLKRVKKTSLFVTRSHKITKKGTMAPYLAS